MSTKLSQDVSIGENLRILRKRAGYSQERAAAQLELMGIPTEQIRVSEHCTCCEPELFCSYRREGGTYMRMGGGLCMKEK